MKKLLAALGLLLSSCMLTSTVLAAASFKHQCLSASTIASAIGTCPKNKAVRYAIDGTVWQVTCSTIYTNTGKKMTTNLKTLTFNYAVWAKSGFGSGTMPLLSSLPANKVSCVYIDNNGIGAALTDIQEISNLTKQNSNNFLSKGSFMECSKYGSPKSCQWN